jgi:phosphoglycolate phosphatase-like HAD superfamily hydrolase
MVDNPSVLKTAAERAESLPRAVQLKRLVLFDIDGTLLHSDGAGREAIRQALLAVYGTAGPIETFSFAGNTDYQNFVGLLRGAGLSQEEIAARLPQAMALYPQRLREIIGRFRVRTCPGVAPLLERLTAHPELEVALLTGNLEEAAWIKLRAAGLDRFFTWGAFGSEARERTELPPVAVEKAHQRTGRRFAGKEIVIIGDTPADITCGQPLGVRTLAVATGPYPREALRAWEPDFLFEDLADADAVLEAILRPL